MDRNANRNNTKGHLCTEITFAGSVLPLFSAARKQPPHPTRTPPAPPASDFISSYFVDQPTFIFIFPPSSITPAACSCCCLLPFIPLFFFFFFHPSVCIHRTGTVSHMASQSLFFTAARSSWKASDETWQVNQPNTVESVKHLDASRLTESTLWCVVQIFCRLKKKKECFARHTLKEFNIFGVIDCNVAVFLRLL